MCNLMFLALTDERPPHYECHDSFSSRSTLLGDVDCLDSVFWGCFVLQIGDAAEQHQCLWLALRRVSTGVVGSRRTLALDWRAGAPVSRVDESGDLTFHCELNMLVETQEKIKLMFSMIHVYFSSPKCTPCRSAWNHHWICTWILVAIGSFYCTYQQIWNPYLLLKG